MPDLADLGLDRRRPRPRPLLRGSDGRCRAPTQTSWRCPGWCGPASLSLVTIGKYLRSWRFSLQKPIRKAYEQDPVAVQRSLEVQYPAIAKRAKREKAVILRLDQTGLPSDASVGQSWAPIGKTPVVLKTGKRFGVNAMTPVSVMRIRGRRVFHRWEL